MCNISPITGVKYHVPLEGYDLCGACEAKWAKDQPVMKLRRPGMLEDWYAQFGGS